MTNPYRAWIGDLDRLAAEGRALPLGGFPETVHPEKRKGAPRVLLFSPHPDDECITGALPLRLLRERGADVVNVAVTQGSNKERQPARWDEMEAACRFLGFDVLSTVPNGLEQVNPRSREADAAKWAQSVHVITDLLIRERPKALFVPHATDWNTTHIGTHLLVVDALAALGPDVDVLVVETEFWAPMPEPNLMVESTLDGVADLVAAISFHAGEVSRNPYHLTLPAWMQDNVRRGGELVGGQGAAVPDFRFATLYRLRRWAAGGWQEVLHQGRLVGRSDALDWLA
jgi:LmbE family N-acetylglucosaminyl deacetylase